MPFTGFPVQVQAAIEGLLEENRVTNWNIVADTSFTSVVVRFTEVAEAENGGGPALGPRFPTNLDSALDALLLENRVINWGITAERTGHITVVLRFKPTDIFGGDAVFALAAEPGEPVLSPSRAIRATRPRSRQMNRQRGDRGTDSGNAEPADTAQSSAGSDREASCSHQPPHSPPFPCSPRLTPTPPPATQTYTRTRARVILSSNVTIVATIIVLINLFLSSV